MVDRGEVSDGYHTFTELYEHRHLLFLSVLLAYPGAGWKSRLHDDGTAYDGWFVAGIRLPPERLTYHDAAISYHLPSRLWELTPAIELPTAPPFDGHTSQDVLQRLRQWIEGELACR